MPATVSASRPTSTPLTEASVPTGMKRGVFTVPWGVVSWAARGPPGSATSTANPNPFRIGPRGSFDGSAEAAPSSEDTVAFTSGSLNASGSCSLRGKNLSNVHWRKTSHRGPIPRGDTTQQQPSPHEKRQLSPFRVTGCLPIAWYVKPRAFISEGS